MLFIFVLFQMFRAMSIRNIASTALKLSPEAAATAYRITEVEKILENNDYFNKYKSALEGLKKSDPVEYLRRLDSLSKVHLKPEKKDQPESTEEEQKKTDDKIDQVVSGSQKAPTGLPFDLNKLLKIELMQDKSVSEVSDIWKKYFATENSICAIIPKKKYTQISTLASVCPQFIYPIPQKDGYEFMVGEWKDNMLFFTSLAHYQKHGDNAPVACSMHHYTNLQESHGIVLMASRIGSFCPKKILFSQIFLHF